MSGSAGTLGETRVGARTQTARDSIFEQGLTANPANFEPLSPISFLKRAAQVYPEKTAVIHGNLQISYREFYARSRRLASALSRRGIGPGDTVAIMAPNVPAMLEAHYGVPMLGAVLNALNIRLDAASIAFMLKHGEAKALITDREFSPVISKALEDLGDELLVIDIDDPLAESGDLIGDATYEALLEEGDPDFWANQPENEWQAISLLYTSGTTGNPKGVVYHHRGAYLNAMGNLVTFGLSPKSVYLWTLPMFHCNGWTFTWAVTAACGTHVCLRKVDPAQVFPMIREHRVTQMCGAPIVLNMLSNAPASVKVAFDHEVEIATGGAAPPSAVIEAMEKDGFRVLHLYGLTESYGPATFCAWQEAWDGLDLQERAGKMARQGVSLVTLEDIMIADPQSMEECAWDGESMGELMLRGNTVMKGYLKNPEASDAAFYGGWFHSGDLAVRHPDGYIEVKDRAKDVIISGGENISSLEIEDTLYRHPKVLEAAVVAKSDATWGETPCAFVTLKDGECADEAEIIAFCRENMASFKLPKTVIFGALPKTSTGKIQKYLLRQRTGDRGL